MAHLSIRPGRGYNHGAGIGPRRRLRGTADGGNLYAEPVAMLWTIIIGLIAGALAKLIMPGRDPGGIIVTILLGIAGAFLAGLLGRALGWYQPGEGAGLIASVIGAIIILLIYRAIRGRSTVVR